MQLRLRDVPFDRGELETWAADVWPRPRTIPT
jgi:hypothetical protein